MAGFGEAMMRTACFPACWRSNRPAFRIEFWSPTVAGVIARGKRMPIAVLQRSDQQ
jgi:hypothetical protein